jgi:hypothetical protein
LQEPRNVASFTSPRAPPLVAVQSQEPRNVASFTSPRAPVGVQLQEHGDVAGFISPTERISQRDVRNSDSESSSSSSHDQGLRPRTRAPKFEPGPQETNAILFQLCTDVSLLLEMVCSFYFAC